mgnify:CR=1 FL=1|jgi:hypothetical protein
MDGTPANEEGCLIRDKALCMDAEAQMKKPMLAHGFLNIDCYFCCLNSYFQLDLSKANYK